MESAILLFGTDNKNIRPNIEGLQITITTINNNHLIKLLLNIMLDATTSECESPVTGISNQRRVSLSTANLCEFIC